jgi:Zn-dependent protease
MFDTQNFFRDLLIRAPGILVGLTIHEYCHGLVALWRGDPTAKQAGRLSLNPFAHLDPFGTLMLLFGPFGWAKPVPVNYSNLENPRRDSALVSVAGPASNILCAIIIGLILRFVQFNITGEGTFLYLFLILKTAYGINIGLSFFNLLPVPPLDGSNILLSILPRSKIEPYLRLMRHVPMIFLVLIFIDFTFKTKTISLILFPLYIPYFSFWNFIIFGGRM